VITHVSPGALAVARTRTGPRRRPDLGAGLRSLGVLGGAVRGPLTTLRRGSALRLRLLPSLGFARERDLELAERVPDRGLRLGGQKRQQRPRRLDRLLGLGQVL